MAFDRPREPTDDPDEPHKRERPDNFNDRHDDPSKRDPAERKAEYDYYRKLAEAEEAEYARREAAGTLPDKNVDRPQTRQEHREQLAAIRDAREAAKKGVKEHGDTTDTDKALDFGPDDEPLTITRAELRHFRETGQLPQSTTERWSGEQPDAENEPETGRGWRTITEEIGEQKSWSSFDAAKKDLGSVPGTDLEHIVEQCQAKPERSGFDVTQINSSDNLTRIRKDLNAAKAAEYSKLLPDGTETLRDSLNGAPWEEQYETGCDILDEEMEKRRDRND